MLNDLYKFAQKLRHVKPTSSSIEAISQLEAYWEDLRGSAIAPYRSQIDPQRILGCLDHCFIIDWKDGMQPRFRLSGYAINRILDMDLRGMPISSIVAPSIRPEFDHFIANVKSMPAKLRLDLGYQPETEQSTIKAKLLMLPLLDPQGNLTRAIGICHFDAAPAALNGRFSTLSLQNLWPLSNYSDQHDTPPQPAAVQINQFGFAEAREEFTFEYKSKQMANSTNVNSAHPSERSYLRLVHSSA